MTMPEDLDELDDDDDDFDGEETPLTKKLRSRLDKANKRHVKQREGLQSENTQLKRELLAHKAGLPDLSDKRLKALLAAHEGEETPEALRATAVDLGWIQPEEDMTDEQKQAAKAQAQISEAGARSQPTAAGTLKPDDVAQWPQDRLRALYKDHPQEYEKLMRGEEIPAIPGF